MKSTNPTEIARAVRSIVAEHLTRFSYDPPGPDFFGRIETFAETLALWGSKLNLTSAPDDPSEIAFHIIDSLAPLILARSAEGAAALADAFDAGAHILDLGSGAGFPALILAAVCAADATLDFTLLEARRKRASFLVVAAAEMGLANVHVDSSRTDSIKFAPVFDIVTARAFAEPAVVYRTAAATLKPDGRALVYASPSQRTAIERASLGRFEPAVFLSYNVPRGATSVAHLIGASKLRP
jgi:16S rRNA (guanine(527)-N(7))-methyltransferase RsmG